MKISQPERGGNGVRTAVVNQTFPLGFVEYPVNPRAFLPEIAHKSGGFIPALSRFQTICCSKSSLSADFRSTH
jgi:hypothetical protein